MARPISLTIAPADAEVLGFASNVTGATWTLTTTATSDSLAHQVTVKNDAVTDHSGKTAVLTGTDADDNALTETISLPAGSATVTSTLYFKTLTSVVPSATIGADTMGIGWANAVESKTIPTNWRASDIAVNVIVSGTIDYTVQQTNDDIQNVASINWMNSDDANLVTATASVNGSYGFPIRATRILINSSTAPGSVIYTVVQADR